MRRRALGRDWSLSYFVLALTSAVTNLPNITPVFHHSRCLTIKYYDFLGLENEILKFLDFPGFSMTCASPATHMLISSSKRTRRCGLERGTSKLSFPKYVNFQDYCILKERTQWSLSHINLIITFESRKNCKGPLNAAIVFSIRRIYYTEEISVLGVVQSLQQQIKIMLCFSFIRGNNFTFLCFKLIIRQ